MTNCPVCNSHSEISFNKLGYDYRQCGRCWTLFIPGGIDQSPIPVGGEHEVGRNEKENHIRIERIRKLVGDYADILDYGAGHLMLVNDLKKEGYNAIGYDKYNPECDVLPNKQFDLIIMVEVIEHTHSGYKELDLIYDRIKPGGFLFVETSFVDVAIEENIPLSKFFYANPAAGHCTIFSHYSLDLLMSHKGLSPFKLLNRNVRIYKK